MPNKNLFFKRSKYNFDIYDSIALSRYFYGDNNLIYKDDRSVIERFDKKENISYESLSIKTIVNTKNINEDTKMGVHLFPYSYENDTICNGDCVHIPSKMIKEHRMQKKYKSNNLYLKHFVRAF